MESETTPEFTTDEKIALLLAFFVLGLIPCLWVTEKILVAASHWLGCTINV